ncbi:MAG: AIM24 family protein [Tepidisphaeraceae bacterium]
MARYTIREFVERTAQQERGQGLFEMESDRVLEVNVNNQPIWTKTGSMVAYLGQIKFTREGMMEHGLGTLLKKAFTGEGARLTKAEGAGKLYLADQGKKITVLQLENEAIFVNGNDVLAFEPSLRFNITMMRKIAAMVSGGLFNVRFEGSGMLAITTHYDPITLRVSPGKPVYTDPNATIAWSGTLQPEFKTDVSLKTFFGRGSGESFQMMFNGDGFVVVQPYEEIALAANASGG